MSAFPEFRTAAGLLAGRVAREARRAPARPLGCRATSPSSTTSTGCRRSSSRSTFRIARASIRPYMEVWKLSETFADRQTRMWPRLESDRFLRDHATSVWMFRIADRPSRTRSSRSQSKNRARLSRRSVRAVARSYSCARLPRAKYYERESRQVAARSRPGTGCCGRPAHSASISRTTRRCGDSKLPEVSHLSRDSATRFTRAYVGVLRERYVGLRTLPEAQPGS